MKVPLTLPTGLDRLNDPDALPIPGAPTGVNVIVIDADVMAPRLPTIPALSPKSVPGALKLALVAPIVMAKNWGSVPPPLDAVTLNVACADPPPYDAVIVAGVAALTSPAVTVNVADVAPACTVTDDGTIAALELDDSVTTAPPAGAAELRVTVPVTVLRSQSSPSPASGY